MSRRLVRLVWAAWRACGRENGGENRTTLSRSAFRYFKRTTSTQQLSQRKCACPVFESLCVTDVRLTVRTKRGARCSVLRANDRIGFCGFPETNFPRGGRDRSARATGVGCGRRVVRGDSVSPGARTPSERTRLARLTCGGRLKPWIRNLSPAGRLNTTHVPFSGTCSPWFASQHSFSRRCTAHLPRATASDTTSMYPQLLLQLDFNLILSDHMSKNTL